jgi:hypothetical protein
MMYVSTTLPMIPSHRGYVYVADRRRRGMGDALQTGETAASIAATGIATTTSILGALGSTLTIAGLAIPVVGVAITALVTVGIAVANMFKGCGQTCVASSNIANQAGDILAQNVNAYTASPIRYASMQAAALNTFDTTWAALQKACSNPALQAAGQRCITDRQAGACTWKASPGGWNADGTFTHWGAAGSGSACWNYFVGMRDPIANDPFVQPDPTPSSVGSSVSGAGESISSSLSSIPSPLLLAGALGIAALALGGD